MRPLLNKAVGFLIVIGVLSGLMLVGARGMLAATTSNQLTKSPGIAQPYVPGEVLVKFKTAVSVQSQQRFISRVSAQQVGTLNQPGWIHLRLPPGLTAVQALAAYKDDPNVEVAQPNYIYHVAATPNDADYGQQWALKNTGQTISSVTQPGLSLYAIDNPGTPGNDLDIEPAWDHITDCSPVTVAVVDTGVNYTQTNLASNMWTSGSYPHHGYDFVAGDDDPMDLNGHGTHLAGIIGAAGNEGSGTAGICWTANIMAVRVLDAAGIGTTATITQGVNFAVTNGARVINLSLEASAFDQAFSDAITNAQTNDVVVVAAAGNGGSNNDSGTTPTYPCNFTQPNLICVAALDQSYQLATFSNYGANSVDVGAPGTNILNTWAGTNAVTNDPQASGWVFSTTTSGGWGYEVFFVDNVFIQFLADPANFPNGRYNNSTDDRTYKAFNIAGANGAELLAYIAISVANGDHFRAAYNAAGGDPFAGGGTIVIDLTNVATPSGYVYLLPLDISGCISATCSLGAQLQSDASGINLGVAIAPLFIRTLTLNPTSYNTVSGTSFPTAHVAGVAAMIMAYNPSYSYGDAVNAIENGGRPVAALAGKTMTGKAVDALGALAYINPPMGLTAIIQ